MPRRRPTRAEQQRSMFGVGLALLGAALAWSTGAGLASLLGADGWHPALAWPSLAGLGASLRGEPGASLIATRIPDVGTVPWILCAGLVGVPWFWWFVRPFMTPPVDPRLKGLAQPRQVRATLSPAAVRKAGRFTRPDLSWFQRRLPGARVALPELGYRLGVMRGTRAALWGSFEVRVRIIARTGWGKTSRLLVWIARELPGAALIGSTSPDLFEQTVRARQHGRRLPRAWWPFTSGHVHGDRWPFTGGRLPWNWRPNLEWRPLASGRWPWHWRRNPAWRPWTRAWWRRAYGPPRPVWVVDFSEDTHRIAEGFPRIRWNPILGCENYTLAQRRARALVAGAEDGDRNDNNDAFFRDSAGHVIAAWLHAAALGRKTLAEVIAWQRNIKNPEPGDILERHPAAQKAARLALLKHLDDRAERTTSSVERFIVLALAPFATDDGEEFATGPSVDIAELIRSHATVYLLASEITAAAVSPLLTMFADEWFHTARTVALRDHEGRLPVPAVGLLDELRRLVPIPSLPSVAAEYRKFGIGLVYALQNQAQEEELYHEQAKSLAQNVAVTVVGGYDEGLVEELIDQAREVDVPSPTIGGGLLEIPEFSDGTTWRKSVSGADLQELAEGDALMRVAGLPLFYATFFSFRDHRGLYRRIRREERSVKRQVAAARAERAVLRDAELATAQASYDRPRTHL